MKTHNLLIVLIITAACAIGLLGSTGCANIIPPTGGPRDSLPPNLVTVKPADSTRSFNAKKIVFEFDEFVSLDNIQENLLVSPTPKRNPTIESKLRTVTVDIKDTLEPNTTYSINFGKAIKDVNEGNILREFTYVFSTGRTIDSLEISGRVIVAQTAKPDSTLIVVLHTSLDDSAVIKQTPRFVTRLDSTGNFRFRNLPPDTFAIYALKDEGGQRKYMSSQQLLAFADSPVSSIKNAPLTLYAYQERDTAKPKTEEKPAAPPKQNGPRAGAKQEKRLRLESSVNSGKLGLLDTFHFQFRAAPLKYFDSSKVILTSETYTPLTGYRFVMDTSKQKVTLLYPWAENTQYRLIIDTAFAEDTAGNKLVKTDTLDFQTAKESEYGLVRLRIMNLDFTQNPVLLFVQSDQVKFSYPLKSREFYARLFQPGEYELRLLFDTNRNGVWDPGEFFGKHIQPEKVRLIPRKLNVKANWDNEVDITL